MYCKLQCLWIYLQHVFETWKTKQFLMFDGKTIQGSFCECEAFFVRFHAVNYLVEAIQRPCNL